MTIKFDYLLAKSELAAALTVAKEETDLPVEWLSHARTVFTLQSKTYTPALATLLLAKALNESVDTLSIKAVGGTSYSMRGLGHSVVVPDASANGYSIRATGREPLNNQPWFRYNRIDEFERVKVRKDYEYFLQVARRANLLSSPEARAALAAFLRVALDEANAVRAVSVKVTGLNSESIRIAAEDFLRLDAPDRPLRLQAFAAACIEISHRDVRTRRLNDPSRDAPGDVHAFVNNEAVLAVEVRGKPVPASEFDAFADACANAGIRRAMLFVDSGNHQAIDLNDLKSSGLSTGAVQALIYESVADFSGAAIAWADEPLAATSARLAERMLERLREIEASKSTLQEWARVVSIVQAR